MSASILWSPQAGGPTPQLTKRTIATVAVLKPAMTNKEVAWCSERVRYYIRQGFQAVYAIERAVVDLRKLNS